MEEMPSLNMTAQRLKLAILPLDLPFSGPITHSREILSTGKSPRKKPDSFSLNDNMDEILYEAFKHSLKVCMKYSLWVISYKQGNGADPWSYVCEM